MKAPPSCSEEEDLYSNQPFGNSDENLADGWPLRHNTAPLLLILNLSCQLVPDREPSTATSPERAPTKLAMIKQIFSSRLKAYLGMNPCQGQRYL